MDLTTFKLDIDDLIDEFTRENFATFADMKKVWVAKKFSYIYEASPRSNSAFFMQSLFSHSIGYMGSSNSLSQRLGGLYCLYCLYETQPYKPHVKIYLCLGELKRLKLLVVEAKQNGILVVPALVKKMLMENMLLFGSSDCVLSTQRVDAAKKLEEKNLQIAYEKLVSKTEIEDYIHMNLGMELDLDSFKNMSQEYAKAKEEAIKGNRRMKMRNLLSFFLWLMALSLFIATSTGALAHVKEHDNIIHPQGCRCCWFIFKPIIRCGKVVCGQESC